jgi:hypothetical protein
VRAQEVGGEQHVGVGRVEGEAAERVGRDVAAHRDGLGRHRDERRRRRSGAASALRLPHVATAPVARAPRELDLGAEAPLGPRRPLELEGEPRLVEQGERARARRGAAAARVGDDTRRRQRERGARHGQAHRHLAGGGHRHRRRRVRGEADAPGEHAVAPRRGRAQAKAAVRPGDRAAARRGGGVE